MVRLGVTVGVVVGVHVGGNVGRAATCVAVNVAVGNCATVGRASFGVPLHAVDNNVIKHNSNRFMLSIIARVYVYESDACLMRSKLVMLN